MFESVFVDRLLAFCIPVIPSNVQLFVHSIHSVARSFSYMYSFFLLLSFLLRTSLLRTYIVYFSFLAFCMFYFSSINLLVRLDFTSKSREFKIEHSNCFWEWPILFERRRNKKELAKTYGCASGSAFYVLLIFLILWLGSYIYCLSHPFCILPSHYFRASFVFILSFVLHHFLLFLLEYIFYGPNETT